MLRHQLTGRQTADLYKILVKGEELAQLSSCDEFFGEEATFTVKQSCDALDMDCLELCVSPLDHDSKGDLFKSAAVSILVAVTIGPAREAVKETYEFLPTLVIWSHNRCR